MNYDPTLMNYFLHASFVVKCVMIILIMASIFSWSYILQRFFYLRAIRRKATKFEKLFWSGDDLKARYAATHKDDAKGMEAIFQAGFGEFLKFRKQNNLHHPEMIDNTRRAMLAAQMREQDKLETHLAFLAIVASTSPYIGLFGTVWGIMQALRALSNVSQATIAMVAPGMAEALIATALGLFAAIPAAIAYNRFITDIGRLMNRFEAFQEELTNVISRHVKDPIASAPQQPPPPQAEIRINENFIEPILDPATE